MIGYRTWLLIAGCLFLFSIIAGLFFPFEISLEDLAPLGGSLSEIEQLDAPLFFIIILLNNIFVIIFTFFLSPLGCLVPLAALTLNGLIIGSISGIIIEQHSIWFLLAGLIPHGILEIPAIIIAMAASLNFGCLVVSSLFKKELRATVMPGLFANLKPVMISLALLVPAAMIEAFITPLLLNLFE